MMKKNPWSKRRSLYSSPAPRAIHNHSSKWRFFPILWVAIKRTCTALGATVLVLLLMSFWMFSSLVGDVTAPAKKLPDKMVLYLELNGDLGELPKDVSFADPFSSPGSTLKVFLDTIDKAKKDDRVQGLYARMNAGGYSLAHIQEMREAIKDFRESGKFAHIYSPSFSFGLSGYYIASAFDEIWMQPMGTLAITGISAELPFVRDVLDKVGVEPQFFTRKEYKSAYESFTNSEISPKNKEAMEALIKDLSDILVHDISEDMIIPEGSFVKLIDKGLFLAEEARDAGLIDRIDYQDALEASINTLVTGDPQGDGLSYTDFGVYAGDMLRHKKSNNTNMFAGGAIIDSNSRPSVALIYAVGAIMDTDGESASSPAGFDDGIAAADEIEEALLGAAYDDKIDAVVLRVDSPGGSPVASETILRAIQIVQEQGKTVTVSMGPTAASGGYWISAYADQIFVMPATITGSIGVLGGKVSAKQLWGNLGVNWERIGWGKNSGMWSMNTPFSESEASRINTMLDNIYDNFIARVAHGRDMSVEEVDKIARGRVWSGKSAIEVGIADQFGGLNTALDYAAVQAGAASRYDVNIVILPKPLSTIERFIQLLEGQVIAGQVLGVQSSIFQKIQPFLSKTFFALDAKNSVYDPIIVQ